MRRTSDLARLPAAVILAAGRSRRMGSPKSLLAHGGSTFLGVWLERVAAAGLSEVRVVVDAREPALLERLNLPPGMVVLNLDADRGMLSSLLLGIEALPHGVPGVLSCPVDHPNVAVHDLLQLIAALQPGRIVVPVYQGRRGHPVLFSAELFAELAAAPATLGARAVVRADAARVLEVEAGRGVVEGVNTPDDYARFVEPGVKPAL